MAITVNNTNVVGFAAATTAVTPLRLSGAPEPYLLVMVALRSSGSPNVSSIVWQPAGNPSSQQAMTQLGVQQSGTQALRIEWWGLLNPTPLIGSNSRINATMSAMVEGVLWVAAFNGVDQTTPYAGYPSLPSIPSISSSTTTGTTLAATVPTAVNDLVVEASAWDLQTAAETFISASGQQYLGNIASLNATISARVRSGASYKVATGTSTAMQETLGNASVALNYIIAGLALKPSTDNSPRWVENNSTAQTANVTLPSATITPISTTGFPAGTASPNSPAIVFGAHTQTYGQNTGTAYYTGSTGTTFTGSTGGTATIPTSGIGSRITEVAGFGQGQSAASLVVIVPSTAQADDIAILNFYVENQGTAVANANWTQITTQNVTGTSGRATFKQVTFYRRIQAGDLVNEASRTFTFTCGSANRNAVMSLYRGCLGGGTGHPGTSPVDASATVANVATSGIWTPPASTATVNNTKVLTLFAGNGLSNTAKPTNPGTGAAVNVERMAYLNVANTDNSQLVAGATGIRNWSSSNLDYGAATIILKPSVGGATYVRNATRTTTTISTTVSRRGVFQRAAALTLSVVTAAVSRVGVFRRSATRTTASIASTVSRRINFNRHATRTTAAFSATVRRIGSSYKRHAVENLPAVAIILHRAGIGIHYLRSAVVTLSAGTVATISRAGSTWRRHATRTTTAISSVASRVLNAGPVTYIRNAVRTTASISIVVGRPGSVWRRTLSRTTATISSTVSRRGAAWKRTATRTTASITSVVSRRGSTIRRHLTRTTASISSTVSRAGSTWRRHAVRTTTAFLALASRTTTSGPQLFIRNASRLTTTISSTVSRRGSAYRRTLSRTTTAITSVGSRRATFNRHATRTTISLSSTVSRRASYKRTLSRSTTSITITVSRQVNGVSISFFPFGTMPILRLWTTADFVGANVYFEANIKSSVTGQAGFARLYDVTAGGPVALSQVSTSAPHDTAQRVRLAAISLLNNHTYRAELGHNTGYNCSMSSADIVVELP